MTVLQQATAHASLAVSGGYLKNIKVPMLKMEDVYVWIMRLFCLILLLFVVVPLRVVCQDYLEAWHLYKIMGDERYRDFDSFYCDLIFSDELVNEAFDAYRQAKSSEAQELFLKYSASAQMIDTLESSDESDVEVAFRNFLALGLSNQLEVYRFCLENDLIDDFTRFTNFQGLWTEDLTIEAFQSLILADSNVLGCRCSHIQYRKALQNGDTIKALRFIKRARREFEALGLGEIKRSFWSSVALTTDGRILESSSLAELSKDRYQAERERLNALELLSEESQAFDLQQYSSETFLYNTLQRTNPLMTHDEFARYIRYPAYSELDSIELTQVVQKIAPPIIGRDSFYVDSITTFHYDPIRLRHDEAWLTSEIGDISGAKEIIDFFPNRVVFDWLLDNLDYERGILVNRRGYLMDLIAFKLYLYEAQEDWDNVVEIWRLFQSVLSAREVPISLAQFLQQLDPNGHDYFIRKFLRGLSFITSTASQTESGLELGLQTEAEFCELARDAMIYADDSEFYRSVVKDLCQRSSSN